MLSRTAENLFWMMVPEMMFWPVLVLATLATIIASQAVISGVFSITQQAVQLGLLPRLTIRRTSETQSGQIFVPTMNIVMLIGVLLLLAIFPTSSELAGAYGLAVTGAMLVDTVLAFSILRHLWRRSLPLRRRPLRPCPCLGLLRQRTRCAPRSQRPVARQREQGQGAVPGLDAGAGGGHA